MLFNVYIRFRRSFGIIMLSAWLVALTILSGCSQTGGGSVSSSPNTQTASTGEQASQEGTVESERKIQHAMGETVVAGTPVKVVTLFQSATDASLALGVKQSVLSKLGSNSLGTIISVIKWTGSLISARRINPTWRRLPRLSLTSLSAPKRGTRRSTASSAASPRPS